MRKNKKTPIECISLTTKFSYLPTQDPCVKVLNFAGENYLCEKRKAEEYGLGFPETN